MCEKDRRYKQDGQYGGTNPFVEKDHIALCNGRPGYEHASGCTGGGKCRNTHVGHDKDAPCDIEMVKALQQHCCDSKCTDCERLLVFVTSHEACDVLKFENMSKDNRKHIHEICDKYVR